MTIASEILQSDANAEIASHARALTAKRDEIGANNVARKDQLTALRAKLVAAGFDEETDSRITAIDDIVGWIDAANAALAGLETFPAVLP